MIRLGLMTDSERVVGATTRQGNEARLRAVPTALPGVMESIYDVEYVVVGASSVGAWIESHPGKVFVLSRSGEVDIPSGQAEVVSNVDGLVDRFRTSEEVLLVAGGRSVWQAFLPYAEELDVAETTETVPGDLHFRDWCGRFHLVDQSPFEGGIRKRYRRNGPSVNHAISLYLDGIRDGNARQAVEAHTGARYTQHSTGVADGREGFIEFFEPFIARNPDRDIRIMRALEDGNHVFLHAYQTLNGGEAQWVTMDLFDTDGDGRVIEHWDVIAAYCPSTPSGHTSVDGPVDVTDLDATDQNKAIVRRVIEGMLMRGGDPRSVESLIHENYIQHNAEVPSGRDAFMALALDPDAKLHYDEIVLLVGQGNFVGALSKATWDGTPYAQTDLFRLENGVIVEHWDAAEPVPTPEVAKNRGKF